MLTTEIKSVATTLERCARGGSIDRLTLLAAAAILDDIAQRVLNIEVGIAVPEAQRIDRGAIEAEGVLLLERYTAAAGGIGGTGDAA